MVFGKRGGVFYGGEVVYESRVYQLVLYKAFKEQGKELTVALCFLVVLYPVFDGDFLQVFNRVGKDVKPGIFL